MSADMEFESAAERALYLSKQVATLTRERDEARADAARKGEALKLTEEALTIHVMADAVCEMGADAGDELAVSMARAALAETTSEAWLAEVKAQARDEALEEAAQGFLRGLDNPGPNSNAVTNATQVRALKRGGE